MSSSDEQVEAPEPLQKPSSLPVTRACDLCRSMKVRCIPDLTKKGMCQRCANTNRECIFKPIKTKRKKRTDTRVAELEREVQAMRALLQRGTVPATPESKTSDHTGSAASDAGLCTGLSKMPPTERSGDNKLSVSEKHGRIQPSPSVSAPLVAPYATDDVFVAADDNTVLPLITTFSAQDLKDLDVIDRGVLSMETARVLFNIYNSDIVALSPFVLVPDSTTADEMRQTKPALFLAIIAAAAGKHDPQLYKTLNAELRQLYGTQLFGEKSLQMVQALMVTAVWYFPPASCRQVKYYEYIHMAATMALDIGIGTKPRKNGVGPSWEVNGVLSDHYVKTRPLSEDAELENRRTFLSCYIMCTEVSMSTRRPTMLRFNKWIQDCLEYVEKSPRALASDVHLVAWARLLRLCEDITTSFGYDGDVVSLGESRVQLMLKSFEMRLAMWNQATPPEHRTDMSQMIFHKVTLYLHELAIHDDHPPEDFKPPWHIEMNDPMKIRTEPTLAEIDAMTTCISSAHSLISIFLSLPTDTVRSLPTHTFFSGVVYSAVVLMKLDISASDPASKLGQYISRETLKVKWYLEEIAKCLKAAVGTEGYRVPSNFLGLLMKFQRNHDASYRLWTGIANDDHQYDVMTGQIITTATDPSIAVPAGSESIFLNGSAMSIDDAMAFDLQVDFDADILGAYNAFGDAGMWPPMGLPSNENMIPQTFNWT